MIYIFHFSIVTILYILFGRKKETENTFIWTTFIYVLFVFGQRWMTGTDFPNYLEYYLWGYKGSEWGYFGLQNFLKANNFYFGILICTILLITQFNFYRFFLKLKTYAPLMILLFLISEMFFAQMSQIRQYVAISFFVNSFVAAYEGKPGKSLLNVILAGSFHASTYFLTPILVFKFPLTKNLTTRKVLFGLLLIALVLPAIDIHEVFTLPIFGRYSDYVGSRFHMSLGTGHYIKYYTMLFVFIFYGYFIKEIDKTRRDLLILNGTLLYIFIYGLSFHFALFFRMAMFFQVFEIVFLVYYANKLRNLPEAINKKLVYAMFLGIFGLASLIDSYQVANYQFRTLRLYEDRPVEELNREIYSFFND